VSFASTLIVTGSNGFVGQSFLEYLVSNNCEFVPRKILLVNRKEAVYPKKLTNLFDVETINIDLTAKWKFGGDHSFLLNLAADGSANAYSSEASSKFMKIGDRLIEWTKNYNPEKVIQASSGACYGIKAIGEIESNSSQNLEYYQKKDLFIKARTYVENKLLDQSRLNNRQVTILRLFSFIGPNILKKDQYAVSSFIKSALTKGIINMTGNPNTVRSYLHEKEMSNIIALSLKIKDNGLILPVGSLKAVKLIELAEFIAKETKSKIHIEGNGIFGDIYLPSNMAFFSKLGFKERIHWKDSVVECIKFYKKGTS
jgi:nucleoside-diphosphate-sugar epimerase